MTSKSLTLGLLAAGVLAAACNVDRSKSEPAGYYFIGHVRDGATNQILTDYTLTLDQAEGRSRADVDEEGLYFVGPLKPGSDYTVTIVVGNGSEYRPFYASEPYKPALPNTEDAELTQIYDAYVFPRPSELPSPAVTLQVYGPHSNSERPTGSVRFTPAADNGTSALDLNGRIAGSVDNQVWLNDGDREFSTVTLDLEDGVLDVAEDDLVYGVAYTATVYATDATQYQSFTFTSGIDGNQTIILAALAVDPLQLVSSSLDTGALSSSAKVVFTFDRDIQLSPLAETEVYEAAIDAAFSINSSDLDADGRLNILSLEDRGTSLTIRNNQLTLEWNRDADNFETRDSGDPILSATYGGLGSVALRAKNGDPSDVTLAALVGSDSVTVRVEQTELAPPADEE